MSGRNFWAEPKDGSWICREEGLPDQTTTHATKEEAWAIANDRAAACHGEAFLAREDGELEDRQWHGNLPKDIKPV